MQTKIHTRHPRRTNQKSRSSCNPLHQITTLQGCYARDPICCHRVDHSVWLRVGTIGFGVKPRVHGRRRPRIVETKGCATDVNLCFDIGLPVVRGFISGLYDQVRLMNGKGVSDLT
jgi:hypothetical protein